ncbi:dihydroxyacetone kinase subunit DhaL [Arcanobacterium hippocoleae]|uniref:Dihydroxyacetone kinase-like protein n=1 Tax=Arcanobacterium hippocoleae TaxID=149017 RepID=A0ABU1T108_9ACTO|nr:dihydroxyacetone kinase subunit DhaL [Arcanobacterium hippocoleae]MDR6939042.1 dihydroxyacetone kinase-like protein [Arcanobacterium hippocoleae]
MGELNTAWAIAWMKGCATEIAAKRDELVELDRVIGDGDHGENLDRGFQAVLAKIDQLLAADTADASGDALRTPADVLKLVAKTLMSTVGGASGPLLGTAFLRAAKEVEAEALDSFAVAAMIEAALGGIQHRGKAVAGEKTMVDVWAPAAVAARAAAASGATPQDTLAAAAQAAQTGAAATIPMLATKGRASYLGERSVGHLDPGAASSSYILFAAVKAAEL